MPKFTTKNRDTTKRKRFKKTSSTINKIEIKKEIKKEKINQLGLSSTKINFFLRDIPNFIGCYAQDELKNIYFQSLPVFFVVNFDSSIYGGTHWIAIYLAKKRLEIFDPLGFNVSRWPNIPNQLLYFLHKFSLHRRVYLMKEVQPYSSTLCGFYCIFFIIFRLTNSFYNCVNIFSDNLTINDKILYKIIDRL